MKSLFRVFLLFVTVACLTLVVVGCSDDDDDKNPVGSTDSAGRLAVVQTTGDDEDNIAIIDLEKGTASIDLLPVGGTCNMTQYGDYVYIVDKGNDRIIKFDPEKAAAISEMSTGAATSPNSIVFVSATKAFVTLSDAPYVAIVNPSDMSLTGTIDISAMANDDGDPDQYHAVLKDGKCFIALRRSSGRSLSDHSSLAVIDAAADTVITESILITNGTGGAGRLCLGGQALGAQAVSGNIYPYSIGSVSDPADGAIEIFDVDTMSSSVLMSESAMGGSMLIWVFDTATTGYAITGLNKSSGGEGWSLKRFDLSAGTFESVSSFQKSEYCWGIDCTSDGLVLVGSKDEENPGVWIFDAKKDYAPVFETPIDVGLLPQRILVVR